VDFPAPFGPIRAVSEAGRHLEGDVSGPRRTPLERLRHRLYTQHGRALFQRALPRPPPGGAGAPLRPPRAFSVAAPLRLASVADAANHVCQRWLPLGSRAVRGGSIGPVPRVPPTISSTRPHPGRQVVAVKPHSIPPGYQRGIVRPCWKRSACRSAGHAESGRTACPCRRSQHRDTGRLRAAHRSATGTCSSRAYSLPRPTPCMRGIAKTATLARVPTRRPDHRAPTWSPCMVASGSRPRCAD